MDIEKFSNLEYLDCSNNNIDSLNLNQTTNLKYLKALESKDQIKFVINDIVDYEYAKDVVTSNNLRPR